MTASAAPRLEVRNASKTFGSNRVLSSANLTIAAGEVHGLVGQNGSGKSTLIKILTGYHSPDRQAKIRLDGRMLRLPVQWSEAQRGGMAVVHQDLGLLDELTVAENICVGGYVRNRVTRKVKVSALTEVAAAVLARLNAPIAPTALVATLSPPQRAIVAIARALRGQVPGAGLLILDESTRALGREDRQSFHAMIRRIVTEGTSVLMVSHDLDEVLETTDRVTILRDGLVAGEGLATAELTAEEIARRMLGGHLAGHSKRDPASALRQAAVPFTIRGLSGKHVRGLDFDVRPGEIVGITGIPGGAFEEIPALVTGAAPASGQLSGDRLHLDLRRASVRTCLEAGVILVPERRVRDGLALDINVADNIALGKGAVQRHAWILPRRTERADADRAIAELDIRPPAPSRLVSQLSGGNQQKVLMAKWLGARPRLLVLHEPTQAVDVGARHDLLRTIQTVADRGIAVLIVSVEPSDLTVVCDRIIVYRGDGDLVELAGATTDEVFEQIYAAPVTQERENHGTGA